MFKALLNTSKSSLACALLLGALPAAAAAQEGPPMWKVMDEDTTIYLFPTVHALTNGIEWYDEDLARVLSASDELVTELPANFEKDPAMLKIFLDAGAMPGTKTLRDLLEPEQRARFEASLADIGMPPNAMDKVEPWFAAMMLSTVPLMQQGYLQENGVEKVLEAKAPASVRRDALETIEGQLAIFDGLPMDVQVRFLMATVDGLGDMVPAIERLIAAWRSGDPYRLAMLMNKQIDDPMLMERLLYARNRNWAEWIDARLDKPGVVFIAVGGGHLAGQNSVQDALKARGIASIRVR